MPHHESTIRNIKKKKKKKKISHKKVQIIHGKTLKFPFLLPLPIFGNKIRYQWPILFMEFGWS